MNNTGKGVLRLLIGLVCMGLIALAALMGFGPTHYSSVAQIRLGLDLAGGVSITYQAVEDNPSNTAMNDTKAKLEARAYTYSNEAEVYREGTNRINVDIPNVSDANTILQEMGKPGSLQFVEYSTGTVIMDGNAIKNAEPGAYRDDTTNATEYVVSLTLKDEGVKLFSEATGKNIGNYIDIVFDDKVVSHARVNSQITTSTCQIEGMESYEAAEKLASTIRIGAIPVELEEIRSNVVGAKLGEDAINSSLIAGAIGLGLVLLFIICYYRVAGLAAALALASYVGMELVVISAFEITLTLPGIAGIILSIGMAVDANVVIFERIREELGRGMQVRSAVKAGFEKALSAIIDGNVTTLIAAAVLFILGSGTIKGFASTLAIGIVISMISALFITRFFLETFIMLGLDKPGQYGVTKERKILPFVQKRKLYLVISLAVILCGFGFMIAHGVNKDQNDHYLNFNIDFLGGTSATVSMPRAYSLAEATSEVVPVFAENIGDSAANIRVNTVNDSTDLIIKCKTLSVTEREKVVKALIEKFGIEEKSVTMENISATVGKEMKRDAIISVLIATFFMLLYIWFRFKDIALAASSVLALFHDVLVVLAFYAVLRWSVGTTFIACMLTIVGYSINATIVVFDRLRENMAARTKKQSIQEVVNLSVTQSVSRSINTSLTTFFTVLLLAILGVAAIKEFALPLIVGIVCGAYSSICLAASLWYLLKGKKLDSEDGN